MYISKEGYHGPTAARLAADHLMFRIVRFNLFVRTFVCRPSQPAGGHGTDTNLRSGAESVIKCLAADNTASFIALL